MKVKVTVFYGENGRALSKLSQDITLAPQEDDPDSFDEAVSYLQENVVEPFSEDGYDLEDDDEEDGVGVDLLAAWAINEYFETKADAVDVLEEILETVNGVLEEIE